MTCRAWRVEGRVQGVLFRASARAMAERLELSGYAENLPDGRVEVAACGSIAALDTFLAWLHEGPPRAEVRKVEEVSAPGALASGFVIR